MAAIAGTPAAAAAITAAAAAGFSIFLVISYTSDGQGSYQYDYCSDPDRSDIST